MAIDKDICHTCITEFQQDQYRKNKREAMRVFSPDAWKDKDGNEFIRCPYAPDFNESRFFLDGEIPHCCIYRVEQIVSQE